MATIKEITHDSSTTLTDHYDNVTDPGGDMTVTPGAALRGSIYGVNISVDGGDSNVDEALTFSTNEFRMRFTLKLSGLTNNNAGFRFFQVRLVEAIGQEAFQVDIQANGGDSGFNILVTIDQDGKSGNATLTGTMPSTGETCIELRAIKETGASTNDGEAELFVNGISQDSDTTLNNNTAFASIDELEVNMFIDTNISGDFFYDEWILVDDEAASLGCSDFVGYDLVSGGGLP